MATNGRFPRRYVVSLVDGALTAPPRAPITLGSARQARGSDRAWCPEELLIGAVLECMWTTFEDYARRERLEVRCWSGSGVAVLDHGSPVPTLSSITLSLDLVVAPGDEERARGLLTAAERRCIASRALNVPVLVEVNIAPANDLAPDARAAIDDSRRPGSRTRRLIVVER